LLGAVLSRPRSQVFAPRRPFAPSGPGCADALAPPGRECALRAVLSRPRALAARTRSLHQGASGCSAPSSRALGPMAARTRSLHQGASVGSAPSSRALGPVAARTRSLHQGASVGSAPSFRALGPWLRGRARSTRARVWAPRRPFAPSAPGCADALAPPGFARAHVRRSAGPAPASEHIVRAAFATPKAAQRRATRSLRPARG
jgi:hypothetical protein